MRFASCGAMPTTAKEVAKHLTDIGFEFRQDPDTPFGPSDTRLSLGTFHYVAPDDERDRHRSTPISQTQRRFGGASRSAASCPATAAGTRRRRSYVNAASGATLVIAVPRRSRCSRFRSVRSAAR